MGPATTFSFFLMDSDIKIHQIIVVNVCLMTALDQIVRLQDDHLKKYSNDYCEWKNIQWCDRSNKLRVK